MRNEELVKYQKEVLNAFNSLEGDRNKPYLLANRKTYSINDIIREVESLSDFGLKQIRSWVRLQDYIKNKKK
jgi:hypothetical protein